MFAQTVLIGRLGKDPELRDAGSSQVATFSVATEYSYKNRDGEWTKKTEFSNVKVWGVNAKNATQYLKKGSLVAIIGRPETESWEDQSGTKKYMNVIVADRVIFLEKKSFDKEEKTATRAPRKKVEAPKINDEDIPF